MADTYDFPPDLLELQRRWFEAESRWIGAAKGEDEAAVSEARATVQDITMALHRHPWMQAVDGRYSARTALRKAART